MRSHCVPPSQGGSTLQTQLCGVGVDVLLLTYGILGWVKNRSVAHNHVSGPQRVRCIHIELNVGRAVVEGSRGKSTVLVGAGNREFIGDQGRGKVVPCPCGEAEDLLVRAADVMTVIHASAVVIVRDPP